MKKIAVYGSGGLGRELAMQIEQMNEVKKEWDLIGFVVDGIEKGTIVNNYSVLGDIEFLNSLKEELYVVLAIGDSVTRATLFKKIKNPNIKFPTLIHPAALLGNREFLEIGEGSIITAGCIITANIKIGRHVLLNLSCTVGHDTNIGDFSSFMPGVNISGNVVIEDMVYVGTGAQILPKIRLGEKNIIGAGSVVNKNMPSNCTAVGVPAKVIKYNN